jgi:hypothetical protein
VWALSTPNPLHGRWGHLSPKCIDRTSLFFFRNDPASLAEAIAGDVYMRRETITMLIHGIPRITSPSADGARHVAGHCAVPVYGLRSWVDKLLGLVARLGSARLSSARTTTKPPSAFHLFATGELFACCGKANFLQERGLT